jgi:hypothetical protein
VNEPAYVTATAAALAELHGLGLEDTARRTWENTLAAFGLDGVGEGSAGPGEDIDGGETLTLMGLATPFSSLSTIAFLSLKTSPDQP